MFEIKKQELAYNRYLKVYQRQVLFPDGRLIDWDIVGQEGRGPHFCTVFPYNTKTKTVCILYEYAQGTNQMLYTLVAGGFDPKKHDRYLYFTKYYTNSDP
jgi:hypothetical protein